MKKELAPEDFAQCPLPIGQHETIQLGHGSGGKMMSDLIDKLFLWAFDNPLLRQMDDAAVLDLNGVRLALSTDSFVVDPIFFPGGNIGELAVNGTVNDISMSGARPLFLSVGMILEEGFSLDELRRIAESMRTAADHAGVKIVTGDTKVVNKGKGDKIYINTTGMGLIERNFVPSSRNLKSGDQIILSGNIAEHGIAILSQREGLAFQVPIESDTASLNGLVTSILDAGEEAVHSLRDPTRGGLTATLNEFAKTSHVGIQIYEEKIPIQEPVSGACELLGLDPLYVANEGKLVAVVAKNRAEKVLEAMHAHPLGAHSEIIGEVLAAKPGMVIMRTHIGGWRIVDTLVGEQLPRIC
ncbi:hydrogenase expression/formation protein HypE [bacterium BMS3Abin05]|nr:hydrogenase expression/formation protein HypE [bacterium BMS3Abin05]GBE26938.1 hydrogenase expression/formation protein HypE [bacterium BMS3Bbin03]HDK36175.1 hydrogenase expression/formation protein HypE [Bacteroidota bacterium]HDZ12330.1 hydrogenase expression/formation protein HypE [Bacteroidota bacterium]